MTQPIVTADSAQTPRFREAFERLIEEIRLVPSEELIAINIDIPTAVTTALGALPEIRALRSRIIAEMPQFDIERFDKLEAYTLAVGHAHALYLAASEPSESIEKLSQDGVAVREVLLADASALAQRRLLDGQRLKELKGTNGYRNLAFDLFMLAALVREAWPKVSTKTALQLSELDQAEMLADRLLTAVGQREQGPAIVAVSAENRQRAFTVFVSAYDNARRAVTFLRWDEDDVEEIAPSLYSARTARRKSADSQPSVPPPPPKTGPTPNVEPAAAANANAKNNPIGVGLPDSEPFVGR